MSMRGWYLVGMLAILFLANLGMLMGMTNWPQRTRESFVESITEQKKTTPTTNSMFGSLGSLGSFDLSSLEQGLSFQTFMSENFTNPPSTDTKEKKDSDGFMDYLVEGTFGTAPIGSYDGMDMSAGLPPESQGFRGRMPNVPHPPGTAMLPFINNECKPECCGASLSCDGGCLCTTPEDRNLINTRGGNRKHEDGF